MSDSATPWTIAHQTPVSVEFSKKEYWSGLPFPSPEHLPDPGIEPEPPKSPALAGRFFTTSTTWEAHFFTFASTQISLWYFEGIFPCPQFPKSGTVCLETQIQGMGTC